MKLSILLLVLLAAPFVFGQTYNPSYSWIYDDGGSGADSDVSCYTPAEKPGFRRLGSVCVGYYGAPDFLVKLAPASLTANPIAYNWAWDDSGSGGTHDGSFWVPICPTGYTAVGHAVVNGYSPPPLNYLACLQTSLTYPLPTAVNLVWGDWGSGASADGSVWKIDGYAIVAPGYNKPFGYLALL